jgi:hypothetical protein
MSETPASARPPGFWKQFGPHAYRAWGLAIFNLVVPTAATAGLLTVIVNTFDQWVWIWHPWEFDYPLVFGWFSALLFVISTGHSSKDISRERAPAILFDLGETIAMVLAFHLLGLILAERPDAPTGGFFLCIALYLACITWRRWKGLWRTGSADSSTAADSWIKNLRWTVLALTVFLALAYWVIKACSLIKNWVFLNAIAATVLWIALVLYLGLTVVREYQLTKAQNGTVG